MYVNRPERPLSVSSIALFQCSAQKNFERNCRYLESSSGRHLSSDLMFLRKRQLGAYIATSPHRPFLQTSALTSLPPTQNLQIDADTTPTCFTLLASHIVGFPRVFTPNSGFPYKTMAPPSRYTRFRLIFSERHTPGADSVHNIISDSI